MSIAHVFEEAVSPPAFASWLERWRAVLARDRRADSAFLYSVETTGIYCRPSCGARLPRQENIRFYASRADAERAGFRPCKRCRPDQVEEGNDAVMRACRLMAQSESPPSLAELASAVGLSQFHLHRIFKASTGVTPKAYSDGLRARRLREALARGGAVTDALYEAGFNSSGRLYAESDALLGMTPTRFRAGGKDEVLRVAVARCTLGAVLVASTDKGVAAIEFGDDPGELKRILTERFPRAHLIEGDSSFEHHVAEIVALIEQPAKGFDLPLDIRGTAFQQRVWQALRDIPPGQTFSYAEVAARIGSPSAVRAVARACAANPVAVAIPCHRVVRKDGSLSGYRWGAVRKRALLDRERT
jgi:AraC family transcriptional regulator of adaptative response/methylated-DNA-[protein]-cysteine methyltransferase